MDFHIKILDGYEQISMYTLKRGLYVVSEARQIGLKMRNSWFTVKGLLILGSRKHSSGYMHLLLGGGAFVHGQYHCKLELLGVLTLEIRAGSLGPSAITWSSYNVAMVSICGYEIDRGKLRPSFQCECP